MEFHARYDTAIFTKFLATQRSGVQL
jgi:hypothetical protein